MTEVPQLFMRTRGHRRSDVRLGSCGRGAAAEMVHQGPGDDVRAGSARDDWTSSRTRRGSPLTIARQPIAFFDLWRELDRAQGAWARDAWYRAASGAPRREPRRARGARRALPAARRAAASARPGTCSDCASATSIRSSAASSSRRPSVCTARRLLRPAHDRPGGCAHRCRHSARRSRRRRAAAGSRGVDPRLRPALLQGEAERRARPRRSAIARGWSICWRARSRRRVVRHARR